MVAGPALVPILQKCFGAVPAHEPDPAAQFWFQQEICAYKLIMLI